MSSLFRSSMAGQQYTAHFVSLPIHDPSLASLDGKGPKQTVNRSTSSSVQGHFYASAHSIDHARTCGGKRHQSRVPDIGDRGSRCARIDPKAASRFALAQPLYHYRVPHPRIQFHSLHPPPIAAIRKGLSLTDFYSGATRQTGRFCEGLLLRRSHTSVPQQFSQKNF
jgi:hypothetical protein